MTLLWKQDILTIFEGFGTTKGKKMMCLGKQKMLIPVSEVISLVILRIGSHRIIAKESEGARKFLSLPIQHRKSVFQYILHKCLFSIHFKYSL